MADQDRDQRTEQPTAKRRRDFKRDGRLAKSQDVPAALSLIGALLVVWIVGPAVIEPFVSGTRRLLVTSSRGLDSPALTDAVPQMVLMVLVPILLVTLVMGVAANIGQVGFVVSPGALKPKISKLSPKNGLQKFAPKRMLWEVARLVLKLLLLTAVVIGPIRTIMDDVSIARGIDEWLGLTGSSVRAILVRSAGLAVVIALGDYIYHRRTLMSQMRMTRREIKDEAKDQDGDPQLQMARRRRQVEMSRNRMIASVAEADVVLLNPVRLAVAIKYDGSEMAPRVIAKGAGAAAARLRKEAYRNAVPVRQDKPLARALYRRCQVGQFVPPELYEAVAAVLAAVIRTRRTARAA